MSVGMLNSKPACGEMGGACALGIVLGQKDGLLMKDVGRPGQATPKLLVSIAC